MEALGRGDLPLYKLQKYGWNTTDVLDRIARHASIPRTWLTYGGRKDRWATTTQYVSVCSRCTKDLSHRYPPEKQDSRESLPFYVFERVGATARPMGPSFIRKNVFKIVVRSLDPGELELVCARIASQAVKYGHPNYFDDQRFRGVRPETGFAAERMLRRQWRGALQSILGAWGYLDDLKEWEAWKAEGCEELLHRISEPWLRKVCQHIRENRGDYMGALRLVPREELSMIFSSYQSFLWDELLRRVLQNLGITLSVYEGDIGAYFFYEPEDDPAFCEKIERLRRVQATLPAAKATFSDELFTSTYSVLLSERGLRPSSFNLRQLRQAFFKAVPRDVLVFPSDFRLDGPEPDEVFRGTHKITLNFALPRGCYGTIVVKRLFARPHPLWPLQPGRRGRV